MQNKSCLQAKEVLFVMWVMQVLSCMCSRWLLFAVVQEVGYGRHCLAESCGLSGNGDEKVGGSGIDVIAQRVVEALQPLCQFGSLVEQDVVTCRDYEYGRQRLQCLVVCQTHRHQRVAFLLTGVCLVEGFKQFGVVAVALGVILPRSRLFGEQLRDGIYGNHLADSFCRHGSGNGKVAARTVAAY